MSSPILTYWPYSLIFLFLGQFSLLSLTILKKLKMWLEEVSSPELGLLNTGKERKYEINLRLAVPPPAREENT